MMSWLLSHQWKFMLFANNLRYWSRRLYKNIAYSKAQCQSKEKGSSRQVLNWPLYICQCSGTNWLVLNNWTTHRRLSDKYLRGYIIKITDNRHKSLWISQCPRVYCNYLFIQLYIKENGYLEWMAVWKLFLQWVLVYLLYFCAELAKSSYILFCVHMSIVN